MIRCCCAAFVAIVVGLSSRIGDARAAFTPRPVDQLPAPEGAPGGHAKADLLGKGTITTSALDVYVSSRVKDLTDGGQSPVMIRPATVPDFPLAMAR